MNPEQIIQREILDWLEAEGIFHRRVAVGPVLRGSSGARAKNPMKGWPDIMGIVPRSPGRLFVIEVKAKKGKLSDDQKQTLRELKSVGVLVVVPRSLAECIRSVSEQIYLNSGEYEDAI